MNGLVSLAQMKKLVKDSPAMKRVKESITHMESILERRKLNSRLSEDTTGGIGSRSNDFPHPDGVLRKIPPDWDQPNLTMHHAYMFIGIVVTQHLEFCP